MGCGPALAAAYDEFGRRIDTRTGNFLTWRACLDARMSPCGLAWSIHCNFSRHDIPNPVVTTACLTRMYFTILPDLYIMKSVFILHLLLGNISVCARNKSTI